MKFDKSLSFARDLDRQDPLRSFRSRFYFPLLGKKKALYFCGNSLGLEPKNTLGILKEELEDWSKLGVEAHFHARRPWMHYHKFSKNALARLTGAKPSEVVAMNQLTVNLHLMMTSFYRPDSQRFRIIVEAGAFSSDQYAFESQIRLHHLEPENALVEIYPRSGEQTLRMEDILTAIRQHGEHLSLVIFPGVQYYSGQRFNIGAIAEAAHAVGAYAGFDLAHAVGNVPLTLHKDNADFAVWCSYKYLNAGPGAVAGAFVHERHAHRQDLQRLAGWWGYEEKDRFLMRKGFRPATGVDGWQLSNFPVFSGAPLMASLKHFDEAGMPALRRKSVRLTGYLEFLLKEINKQHDYFSIITPADPDERGCQLSLLMKRNGKKIFDRMTKGGVIADWREPDVIRLSPVPLYNSFEDIFRLVAIMAEVSADS